MTRTQWAILVVAAMAGTWAAPVCDAVDAPATTDAVSVVATQPAPTSRTGLDQQKVLGDRDGPGRSGGGWEDLRGIVQTFLALAVVGALVLALRWGLGRLGRSGTWRPGGAAARVLWRQEIGRNPQLLLVQWGSRLMLIGAGQSGMSVLAEVNGEAEVQRVLGSFKAGPSAPGSQPEAKP